MGKTVGKMLLAIVVGFLAVSQSYAAGGGLHWNTQISSRAIFNRCNAAPVTS